MPTQRQRLGPRPRAMAIAVLVVVAFVAIPLASRAARAQPQPIRPRTVCTQDEAPLFICETNRKNKLQGTLKLFFSHEVSGSLYTVGIRFRSGGFTYLIESAADDASDPPGQGAAGLTVSDASGKTVSQIDCIERPAIYPAYLQRALACDPENPHGKAGCADPAPPARSRRPRTSRNR